MDARNTDGSMIGGTPGIKPGKPKGGITPPKGGMPGIPGQPGNAPPIPPNAGSNAGGTINRFGAGCCCFSPTACSPCACPSPLPVSPTPASRLLDLT